MNLLGKIRVHTHFAHPKYNVQTIETMMLRQKKNCYVAVVILWVCTFESVLKTWVKIVDWLNAM